MTTGQYLSPLAIFIFGKDWLLADIEVMCQITKEGYE